MTSAWAGTGVEDGKSPPIPKGSKLLLGVQVGEGSSGLFLWFVSRVPSRKEDGPRLGEPVLPGMGLPAARRGSVPAYPSGTR